MPITAIVDANGVAVNVGDTVYIAGTVTALDNASRHYREVTFTLNHPLTGSPNYLPRNEIPIDATASHNTVSIIHGPSTHVPGGDYVLRCSGLILNH